MKPNKSNLTQYSNFLTFFIAAPASLTAPKYLFRANIDMPMQIPQPKPVKKDKLNSIFCFDEMIAFSQVVDNNYWFSFSDFLLDVEGSKYSQTVKLSQLVLQHEQFLSHVTLLTLRQKMFTVKNATAPMKQ